MAIERGWGFPWNARKAHYFNGAVSLCGKWMYTAEGNDALYDHGDYCTECMKKYERLTKAAPLDGEEVTVRR